MVMVTVFAALSGCTGRYGGRPFSVTFHKVPEEGVLYVIPEPVWLEYGEAKLFNGTGDMNEKLRVYRCDGSERLVELRTYVLVFESKGKRVWRYYTPKEPKEEVKITAE
jgi:hypothetical protein